MSSLEDTGSGRRSVGALGLFCGVLVLAFAVYQPGLSGPLLLDDLPQLDGLMNQGAGEPSTLFRNYIISTSGPTGRPVSMATFVADAIGHGADTWWWKYGNVVFHLISGLLVFWVTALLMEAAGMRQRVDPWIGGLVVGALWLLHPLQVSTVLYTVQRMTELSTLFVLAALVCYVRGRLLLPEAPRKGWLLIGTGFLVFFPLGVFSKENALVYPLYCSLIELLFFRLRGESSARRGLRVLHAALAACYVAAFAYLLVNFQDIVLDTYATRDFTLVERLLTQFRVIAMYLSMLLLPVQRNMGFFHDDIALSTGFLQPVSTLLSALLLLGLLASAVLLRRKSSLYAFGILFFFVSHLIESTVLGLELAFEHRNYAGSIGIIIAMLALSLHASTYLRSLAVVAAVGILGFALLTWQRANTWSSPVTLYNYMYSAHPESPRLNLMLSNKQASSGDFDAARAALDRVGPGLGTDLHRLFLDCLEFGRIDERALAKIARHRDGVIEGHVTSSAAALAQQVIEGGCEASPAALLAAIDRVLECRARSTRDLRAVLLTKARLLESTGAVDLAVETYLVAQERQPDDALPLYRAAALLTTTGQLDAARDMLTQARETEQQLRIRYRGIAWDVYLALARAYEAAEQYADALDVYRQAHDALPDNDAALVKALLLERRLHRRDEADRIIQGTGNGDKLR